MIITEEGTLKKLNTRLVIIFLVAITALVYANSLKNNFVWDDYLVIVDNGFVKSWENFPAIFSKSYLTSIEELKSGNITGSGETTYRPIVTISYFLDYQLWKLNPFGYHLTNLLLHLANVILLYFLICLLVKNEYIAFLASLFFALHPVNTEAVSVISFRKDLLVFLFSASSLILFIKQSSLYGKKKFFYSISSISLFLLALFSKEMAIMLPAIFLLYEYFFVFNQGFAKLFRHALSRYQGYILAIIFYLAVWVSLKNSVVDLIAEYPYPGGNFYTNLLTMSRVVGIYIAWLIFPINIHATLPESDPVFTLYSIFNLQAAFSVFLIILLLVVALVMRKKSKEISFAILWFFIALFPVSNIFPISSIIAGRYLYVPMVGFSIALAVLLFWLYNLKSPLFSRNLLHKFVKDTVIILAIFYSIFTVIRNLAWKNNLVLRKELVEYYPGNPDAHLDLASQLKKVGLRDQAINEYRIAIRLNPNYPKTYNSLAVFLAEGRRYEEAANLLKKAIDIDKKYLCAYNNLAVTYAEMNKLDEARVIWLKALEIDPSYKQAAYNLEKLKQLGRHTGNLKHQ